MGSFPLDKHVPSDRLKGSPRLSDLPLDGSPSACCFVPALALAGGWGGGLIQKGFWDLRVPAKEPGLQEEPGGGPCGPAHARASDHVRLPSPPGPWDSWGVSLDEAAAGPLVGGVGELMGNSFCRAGILLLTMQLALRNIHIVKYFDAFSLAWHEMD